jgi:hypothetical protein
MILHAANDNFANSQHPFFGDQTDSNYLHSSQAGSSFFFQHIRKAYRHYAINLRPPKNPADII